MYIVTKKMFVTFYDLLSRARQIPINAESSSSDEGGTVGMDEVESDPGVFDNNVNPEDGKSSTTATDSQHIRDGDHKR